MTGRDVDGVMSADSTADPDVEEVHWLSPREQAAWRTYLDSTRQLLHTLEAQLQADAGMPMAYYEILVNLSEAPDRTLRMGALATAVRSSTSRLSHAVSRMEDCGWVRREAHPTDRRATFAVLTDDGRAALANAAPGHVNAVREHLLRRLSPEQLDQLIDISRAIDPAVERTPAV
jgi:DNA-binding MarR family transcriptional regulator